jgi:hypothetical protein
MLVARRPDLFKPNESGSKQAYAIAEQPFVEKFARITTEEGPQWLHSIANNHKLLEKD